MAGMKEIRGHIESIKSTQKALQAEKPIKGQLAITDENMTIDEE